MGRNEASVELLRSVRRITAPMSAVTFHNMKVTASALNNTSCPASYLFSSLMKRVKHINSRSEHLCATKKR